MARSPYEVLEIATGSSSAEIQAAYHDLAMRFHPDRLAQADPQTRAEAEFRMKEINAAYSTLLQGFGAGIPPNAASPPGPQARPNQSKEQTAPPKQSGQWMPPVEGTQIGNESGRLYTCWSCGTRYRALQALCPRCQAPNRPLQRKRRWFEAERMAFICCMYIAVWVFIEAYFSLFSPTSPRAGWAVMAIDLTIMITWAALRRPSARAWLVRLWLRNKREGAEAGERSDSSRGRRT